MRTRVTDIGNSSLGDLVEGLEHAPLHLEHASQQLRSSIRYHSQLLQEPLRLPSDSIENLNIC